VTQGKNKEPSMFLPEGR